MLSDGADNSGGIDLATIAAIRRQRIPIHTIGYGKEHPDKDVEITDAVVPARALPDSKLTATVTLQSWGVSGGKTKLTVREGGKILVAQEVTLKDDGRAADRRPWSSTAAPPVPRRSKSRWTRWPARRTRSTTRSPAWSTCEARKPRILYIQGEPVWEYKFIRRAIEDYPDIGIELPSMLRTTQNKIYRQGIRDAKELEDGFPAKPEELFAYQGLIIGGVEAGYFTDGAAAGHPGLRGSPRRRTAVHRRTRQLERWRLAELAAGGPGAGAAARKSRHLPPRFLQRGADRAGRAERDDAPG